MGIDFIIWIIIRCYIFLLTFPTLLDGALSLVPVSLRRTPITAGLLLPLGGPSRTSWHYARRIAGTSRTFPAPSQPQPFPQGTLGPTLETSRTHQDRGVFDLATFNPLISQTYHFSQCRVWARLCGRQSEQSEDNSAILGVERGAAPRGRTRAPGSLEGGRRLRRGL